MPSETILTSTGLHNLTKNTESWKELLQLENQAVVSELKGTLMPRLVLLAERTTEEETQ